MTAATFSGTCTQPLPKDCTVRGYDSAQQLGSSLALLQAKHPAPLVPSPLEADSHKARTD